MFDFDIGEFGDVCCCKMIGGGNVCVDVLLVGDVVGFCVYDCF